MRHFSFHTLLLAICCATAPVASYAESKVESQLSSGKALAFSQQKGNCLACHLIAGGESPGNIGPPLISMKLRYPDKQVLRLRIWNAAQFSPNTPMPPFGKHHILTESEIDDVVEFVWSL
ncbi:MAG: sulfur oxidation c-type cytochrome SoxX [Methylococcales bacterium]|jgi:L-cysteine S-thiosulfotransferase|nr:sulfur oxidation c-type cytochrome SoxX [Methylococcales bacterium]MBT7444116.1 sulfur oxidation c-type cytochrome SoxX [Methylococcales bacterium]